jgi:hypothetical protein
MDRTCKFLVTKGKKKRKRGLTVWRVFPPLFGIIKEKNSQTIALSFTSFFFIQLPSYRFLYTHLNLCVVYDGPPPPDLAVRKKMNFFQFDLTERK